MTPEPSGALAEARRALDALAGHSIDDSDSANDTEIFLDSLVSALAAFLESLPKYRALRIPGTKFSEWLEKNSIIDGELRKAIDKLSDLSSSAGYDHQLDEEELREADALREQVADGFDGVLDDLAGETA